VSQTIEQETSGEWCIAGLPAVIALEMFRRMVRIRGFEIEAERLFDEGHVRGAMHTCIGQEATVVGACAPLTEEDKIVGTHRSHGHPLAKGADPRKLMAELLGKETGVCKGKGGSMHLADFSVGSLGESGIVAGGLPVAVGAGLSSQVLGTGSVALAFFGDGAVSEGIFHESLNFASLWKLPCIFLCENNGYAATTSFEDSSPVRDVAQRAAAYDMPSIIVNGQDVIAVREAVTAAVTRARNGGGPTLVEAKTYRFDEHAYRLPIKMPYRSPDEVADRSESQDPVIRYRERLLACGAPESQLAQVEQETAEQIAEARRFALDSAWPDPATAFADLYA
jgi:pyruvate dehydrogenase E1 component alpha subunit